MPSNSYHFASTGPHPHPHPQPLTMNLRRNAALNLAAAAATPAISLFTIPLYLTMIGADRYGVMALVWLLLGYFGLIDLGVAKATAYRIAGLQAASAEKRAETLWTALTINLMLGLLGALLLWPIATIMLTRLIPVDAALASEIHATRPWLALSLPLLTTSAVLSAALQGEERFLELNVIQVSSAAAFQTFPLLAAMAIGPRLDILVAAAMLARCFALILFAVRCRDMLSRGPATARAASATHLLKFGGWVTISAITGPVMLILDRFLIGAQLGPVAVTIYSVPYQLSQLISLLPGALCSALFPRLSSLAAQARRPLAQQALRLLLLFITPCIVAAILLLRPFLVWWIDEEFANTATTLAQLMLIGIFFNSSARVALVLLLAEGRPDLVAKCHLLELIPFIGLLYLALIHFGLIGAAVAISVRMTIDFFLLLHLAGLLQSSAKLFIMPTGLIALAFASVSVAAPTPPAGLGMPILTFMLTSIWLIAHSLRLLGEARRRSQQRQRDTGNRIAR